MQRYCQMSLNCIETSDTDISRPIKSVSSYGFTCSAEFIIGFELFLHSCLLHSLHFWDLIPCCFFAYLIITLINHFTILQFCLKVHSKLLSGDWICTHANKCVSYQLWKWWLSWQQISLSLGKSYCLNWDEKHWKRNRVKRTKK